MALDRTKGRVAVSHTAVPHRTALAIFTADRRPAGRQ